MERLLESEKGSFGSDGLSEKSRSDRQAKDGVDLDRWTGYLSLTR